MSAWIYLHQSSGGQAGLRAGVPPGPEWGVLMRAAEDLQLEGALKTRAEAVDWLARQVASE